LLRGSYEKDDLYKYPLYSVPGDLLRIDLSSLFPELKNKRVRGRLEGSKVVPYFSREEINSNGIDSEVICYVDSQLDRFFLEIQGSGRVEINNTETIFVGYADQNGHPYRSIGKVMIERNLLEKEEVSLQSIKSYLKKNPNMINEILHANASSVFFKKRDQAATGAMGLVLTPERSVAIDRRYIPLGALLFIQSDSEDYSISRFVFAQDTGGAIRGAVRADMFMGYGEHAEAIAGGLNAPLQTWIMLPKALVAMKDKAG
jgi:membrane-bound lytic murein transglycosylase A